MKTASSQKDLSAIELPKHRGILLRLFFIVTLKMSAQHRKSDQHSHNSKNDDEDQQYNL